jgi:hypothetical protein
MVKLHYKEKINALREKVWDIMFAPDTYKEWTKVFNPSSRYEGSWEEGTKMLFVGFDPKTGEEGGMVSFIKESRKLEFMSIEHRGIIKNGKEIFEGEEVEKWVPALENYTFKEVEGGTEVLVDMDVAEGEFETMFNEMWPKALAKLKELCEAN